MRAPSDLQQRARALAAPEGDALGVGLRRRGEQEARVAPARFAGEFAGLEQRDQRALFGERVGERDTGDAAADDEHFRFGRLGKGWQGWR